MQRAARAVFAGEEMEQEPDILDNLSTGVLALDADLNVLTLNAAGQALLETSEARCIGLPASQLLLQSREWCQNLEQVVTNNSPLVRRGMRLVLHSGHEIHADLIITPVVSGDIRLLVEMQPVDRLLRISREEGFMHAQETTRAVIRGLAHEIKNPLGGVRGAAQLLARELPGEELAEYTNIIIREADRLRDLVDQLLGPNQQLKLQTLNIHEVLEHVRNLILAEFGSGLQIERDYDPSLPEFSGDRSQLTQVVLNVMRNAVQAAPDREACRIILRTRSQRQFTIGNERHRLVCRVDIVDNGPGIPEDLQQAIFVPMVTGRADGSGLGLSLAQSMICSHGGLLECDSKPGNTRFTIYLPMDSKDA
jgi:two-component system nitrogen regulation sensor histidine kinase GlnL